MLDKYLLCKVRLDLPSAIDLNFDVDFDETAHGAYLLEQLLNIPPSATIAARFVAIVKKHWRVFNPEGVK